MAGKVLQCTDRIGQLLANKAQATQTLTLLPDRKVYIS